MASDYNDSFAGTPYFISKGEPLSADGVTKALNTREKVVNKVTSPSVLSDSSTDEQYPSAKVVYRALAEVLRELETQLHAASSAVSGKQDSLPLGAILMYDGTSWQDNVTLSGWYSCNRTNYNNGLTPDLEDKFIKGKGSLANTGGNNTLTDAMLPKHSHSFTTTSTSKVLTGSFDRMPCRGGIPNAAGIFSVTDNAHIWYSAADNLHSATISIDARHEHSGSTNNDNSAVTNNNYNNMPAYYSLIYIKRVR